MTDKGKETKISIQVDSYKIKTLREQINTLKAGTGPGVKLVVSASPSDDEEDAGIKLLDTKITLPSGRAFWTFGDNLDSDAFLPKASAAWGTQFALKFSDGKFYIKDQSALGIKYHTYIRLVKGEPYPLKTGDIVNLANAVVYAVEGLGNGMATFQLQQEIAPSINPYDTVDRKEFSVAGGAIIGKLKKHAITMKHALASGTHCTISEDSLTDSSGNGTFLGVRNEENLSRAQQSGWVGFEKANPITFNCFEVLI